MPLGSSPRRKDRVVPAKSKSQQRLMAAAEHGATFPMAEKLRQSMTHSQLHDFASGSEKGKPEHVRLGKQHATHGFVRHSKQSN